MRRLISGQCPSKGGWLEGKASFLGRGRGDAVSERDDVEELADVMEMFQNLHPVNQAALLFHAWRIAGQGPAQDIEAVAMAASHSAWSQKRRVLTARSAGGN